jgi:hypothetical protein
VKYRTYANVPAIISAVVAIAMIMIFVHVCI